MRQVIGAALMILPATPAFAGGVGVLATGGMHTEKVYYYSNTSPEGDLYSDIDDYDQYQLTQTLPQLGGGFELVLGDRDDRIMGTCRFFYNLDAPQLDPATLTDEIDPDYVVANIRDTPRHLGFGMVGLSWGILGDPGGFQLAAVGHVGTAFLTFDHTEFFAFQVGPGITYRMARQVQLFGDVQIQGRFSKGWSQAGYGTVGVRYLFD
ncbi:MAG TPA: hypothetical protein ENK18_25280 [Deltaproteobacteria bacterium]|nr:hypothetical protein [Deltaproteobacteria bacterium]